MKLFATLALLTPLFPILTQGLPMWTALPTLRGSPMYAFSAVTHYRSEPTKFWCHGNGKGEIYFLEPAAPSTIMVISTPWKAAYPGELKEELRMMGFVVIKEVPKHDCGWWQTGSVTRLGVKRGSFGFHASGEQDKGPSDETIGRIQDVLASRYPGLEIFLVCFFSISGLPLIYGMVIVTNWIWWQCLWCKWDASLG